ncbi:MAG TPA: D-2-hydroxyacid dehydrogenase [bacterium]|nr:D-2-hydroxyacid dehydrogenase [bacterium]
MKIVFLDAGTVDLGDVDISPLRRLGSYRAFADTPPSQVVSRARGSDAVVTNKCVLGAPEIAALPRLKLIAVAATGVNNVDLAAARRKKIAVANVAGYSTATVAEHALLFLLACSHRLREHHEAAWSEWSRSGRFALLDHPYADLCGKTLGVLGYGAIGRRVARLARAFGMKIAIARLPGRRYPATPKRKSLQEVLRLSDFVSLHCPLAAATRHLINRTTLGWMRPGAFLLNLSRGAVVSEEDVAQALLKGRLAGYATDVLSREPPLQKHPLLDRRLRGKILMTPHVAWASRESRQRLVDEIARNIRAFQNGWRRNRIV